MPGFGLNFGLLRESATKLSDRAAGLPEILVHHVDLAYPAALARGIDETAKLLAAWLCLLDMAHDEVADARRLVARRDADVADARPLVEQAEIHSHVLDAIELDLVDRFEHDAAPHDQPLGRDLVLRGHVLDPLPYDDQHGETGEDERPGA